MLENGNKSPSIPVGDSVRMKEEYENVKVLLDMIKYTSRNWERCDNFKMLAFLLGQQGGGGVQSIHALSAYGIVELMFSIIQESSDNSEKN